MRPDRLLLVVCAASAMAAAPVTRTATPLPQGVTPEMVDRGKVIFQGVGRCARCHGPNATGTDRGSDLSSGRWLHTHGQYEEIVQVVTNGVPKPKEHPLPMPPRGGSKITPDQIRDVAAFVWRRGHPDQPSPPSR